MTSAGILCVERQPQKRHVLQIKLKENRKLNRYWGNATAGKAYTLLKNYLDYKKNTRKHKTSED